MKTELAQIISLTSYGNDFLLNGKLPESYYPDNNIFQFCNSVDFRDFRKHWLTKKSEETIAAKNPLEWFELLKKEGCKKIRLYYQPMSSAKSKQDEYNHAAFVGGGGTWLIETIFSGYSNYWSYMWEVTNKDAANKRIWGIKYGRNIERAKTANMQLDVEQVRTLFEKTLMELMDFCHNRQYAMGWTETFEKAHRALLSPNPNKGYYHEDLIVLKNYSLLAQQVLFTAGHAWVFGGMGWWNDMIFDDKTVHARYLELSAQLYDYLMKSILAGTNSF